jgi:multidrug transporter EmrE-like cation transporter
MAYKALGFAVWHGGGWLLRRRYGHLVPSRRVGTAGVVGLAVTVLAVAALRREQRTAAQ